MGESAAVRFVVFRVGDLVCALPVGMVREIIAPLPPTRIPGAPAAVQGLVNVRGSLLTVVDGHAVLQRPRPAIQDGSVLVLELGDRVMGLEVDDVLDLLEMPESELEPREALPGVDPRLAKAVGRSGGRVFVVLDPDTLLEPMVTA